MADTPTDDHLQPGTKTGNSAAGSTGEEEPLREGESRRDRFRRIGARRMNSVLNDLRLLGNLRSPAYDYTEDEIDKMEMAITEAMSGAFSGLRERLNASRGRRRRKLPDFTFE